MANVILGYPNVVDLASLSGGSWVSSLPLANLQDRRISKKARSSNLLVASTKFMVTLDRSRSIELIGLIGHNLTVSASWRVRGSMSSDFSSPLYDSGWRDVWTDVSSETFGSLEWESDSYWDGKLGAEERVYYPGLAMAVMSAQASDHWLIEINDVNNLSGYVEIGRLFVGGSWQVENNPSYGWSLGYEDNSIIEESIGGAEYYDQRPRYRVIRFGLNYITMAEGLSDALGVSRVLGQTGEVLLVWDSADTNNFMRRSFLGRLRTLAAVENPDPVRYTTSFEIKEIIA